MSNNTYHLQPRLPDRRDGDRRLAHDDDGERRRLSRHAGGLQAGPAGPALNIQTACSTSVVAVHRRAEPVDFRVRRGAGGRRVDQHPIADRVPGGGRLGVFQERQVPGLRRRSRGDPVRRRRGRGGAQASGGGAGGRGQHPRGGIGLGGQQRRCVEGGLHGAERGGPGGGDLGGAGSCRRAGRVAVLHRSARDGDAAGRSDRDPGADEGVPGRKPSGGSSFRSARSRRTWAIWTWRPASRDCSRRCWR